MLLRMCLEICPLVYLHQVFGVKFYCCRYHCKLRFEQLFKTGGGYRVVRETSHKGPTAIPKDFGSNWGGRAAPKDVQTVARATKFGIISTARNIAVGSVDGCPRSLQSIVTV